MQPKQSNTPGGITPQGVLKVLNVPEIRLTTIHFTPIVR